MKTKLKKIIPNELIGPRSYFTDIDPKDQHFSREDSIRNLKLQLLTKDKIIVAASSLFHNIWMDIFADYPDLTPTLTNGIIVPALRNQFEDVADFFGVKKYPEDNKKFFIEHVTHVVPWDLNENTSWFKQYFLKSLLDDKSVLRKRGEITQEQANSISLQLEELIKQEPRENRFLQTDHIKKVAENFNAINQQLLIDYARLIYRLSGARVVNSEGHFPQSNYTGLRLAGNDQILHDEYIFWDIYAETVFTYLGTAARLTKERLDNLQFKDILEIRKALFDNNFSLEYDKLLKLVKNDVNLIDPEKLILHMQEISAIAVKLREQFSQRVRTELSLKDTAERENALWQIANVFWRVYSNTLANTNYYPDPTIIITVGVLSTCKSLPEITALFSPRLSSSIKLKIAWMRNFVNTRIGWSQSQRKTFLEAYKILATYGLK